MAADCGRSPNRPNGAIFQFTLPAAAGAANRPDEQRDGSFGE